MEKRRDVSAALKGNRGGEEKCVCDKETRMGEERGTSVLINIRYVVYIMLSISSKCLNIFSSFVGILFQRKRALALLHPGTE